MPLDSFLTGLIVPPSRRASVLVSLMLQALGQIPLTDQANFQAQLFGS